MFREGGHNIRRHWQILWNKQAGRLFNLGKGKGVPFSNETPFGVNVFRQFSCGDGGSSS
jgi:hypothetical protein